VTSSDRDPQPTPLEDRLALTIKAGGPISVGDFIEDALGHPQYGFYTAHEAIGAGGAFTTAPEISQVFGEIVGAWLVDGWSALGEPGRFALVELGPGRGVLMADILRVAARRPEFLKGAQVRLYERSARLRLEQSRRLKDEADVDWLLKLEDAPATPMLVAANEFLDCLPIRQFQKTEAGWRERLVGLGEDGGLAFVLADAPAEDEVPAFAYDAKPGAIVETRLEADRLVEFFCKRFLDKPGRAIFIDYGHARSGLGDTLQAVRGHERVPPLSSPGLADVTSHVDFQQLARTAAAAGCAVYGPVTQGSFLARLGAVERTAALSERASREERTLLQSGLQRLVAPGEMGEVFKVLCISSPGLRAPAGFAEF